MAYESRAYDNDHGDPVVVLVATGTHDVSRLVNLLAGSRMALCEHMDLSERILRQVRRHNGGRAALKLLAKHGGPDLSDEATPAPAPEPTEAQRLARTIVRSAITAALDDFSGLVEQTPDHATPDLMAEVEAHMRAIRYQLAPEPAGQDGEQAEGDRG